MANSSMGELIFFMRGNKLKSKRSLEIVRSKIRDEFQKELDRSRRKRLILTKNGPLKFYPAVVYGLTVASGSVF